MLEIFAIALAAIFAIYLIGAAGALVGYGIRKLPPSRFKEFIYRRVLV